MGALDDRDVQNLLSAVAELHSDTNPATIVERTLGAVKKVVAADYISFDGFVRVKVRDQNAERHSAKDFSMPRSGLMHHRDSWYSYDFDLNQEEITIADVFSYESPMFSDIVANNHRAPGKISDFTDIRNFHHSTIYNELYRRWDSHYHMALMLPVTSGVEMSCGIGRSLCDFSEDDRLRLALIAPHLGYAINNARALKKNAVLLSQLDSALEAGQNAVIVIGTEGERVFATRYAENLLAKYFNTERRSGGLPVELRRWLEYLEKCDRAREFSEFPAVFIVQCADGELYARLIYQGEPSERILLLEEKPQLRPHSFALLGITARESEILYWTMKGKTDAEIALICHLGVRTVQKHQQKIQVTLGVENRTAAVLRALETLDLMKKVIV